MVNQESALIGIRREFKRNSAVHCSIMLNGVQRWQGLQNGDFPVPDGVYNAILFVHSETETRIKLLNVPGHSDLEIHIANFITELSGCTGIGKSWIGDNLQWSRKAMEELLNEVRNCQKIVVAITTWEQYQEVKRA